MPFCFYRVILPAMSVINPDNLLIKISFLSEALELIENQYKGYPAYKLGIFFETWGLVENQHEGYYAYKIGSLYKSLGVGREPTRRYLLPITK